MRQRKLSPDPSSLRLPCFRPEPIDLQSYITSHVVGLAALLFESQEARLAFYEGRRHKPSFEVTFDRRSKPSDTVTARFPRLLCDSFRPKAQTQIYYSALRRPSSTDPFRCLRFLSSP